MSDHQEDSRGYSRELLESESEKKIVAKHKSSEFLPNMRHILPWYGKNMEKQLKMNNVFRSGGCSFFSTRLLFLHYLGSLKNLVQETLISKFLNFFLHQILIQRGQRWRKNFCVMKEKGFCGQTQAPNLNAISNIIKYKNQFSKTND